MTGWNDIWDRREAPPVDAGVSTLRRLLIADGMDSGFAGVTEEAWRIYTEELRAELGLAPGMSAYEIGCGAGAFLLDWARRGVRVGGLDRSPGLVAAAREALPHASFSVADAGDLTERPTFDAVVSMGVFLYFPSRGYAASVIRAMARKADHAIAILDLPDAARSDECRRYREQVAGGPEAYARRYGALSHLEFERSRVAALLRDCGLVNVMVEDQRLASYGNARFRFNAWGFVGR